MPDTKRGRNGVHQIDTFLNSFDKSSFKHGKESDLIVTAELLVLLEVLNILFSSVHTHGNILEFGMSSCSGVRVTEVGLELVDEVLKGGEWGI